MRSSTAIGTVLVIAVTLAGCVVVPARRAPGPVVVQAPGPPPHAPAHGHRRHASGVDLRFDPQLGVYAVVGYTGIYFSDDLFIRWYGGRWQVSRRVGGPWVVQAAERVPKGLRAKHHHHHHHEGPKAHGYGPAKAGW